MTDARHLVHRFALVARPEYTGSKRCLVAMFANGQHSGELLLSRGEWQLLACALRLGAERTSGHATVTVDESVLVAADAAESES